MNLHAESEGREEVGESDLVPLGFRRVLRVKR